jgi:phosphatidylserine decarboxylase
MELKCKTCLTFILLMNVLIASAQKDCPPVTKLKSIYSSDNGFKLLVDSMFDHVQNMPDGSPNFWKNKNINDLYAFLNEWFYTLPTTANGLDKIIEFSLLYYHNPYGLRFVNQEPGLSWSIYFVKEEGKFMDSKQSTGSIPQWLADSTLHNDEYENPPAGYNSFNQFFTRNLKPGMRPITRENDNSVIISPVDGIINWIDNDLKPDSALPVKGRMKLNVDQLLGHSPLANHFIDGTGVAIILLPQNYHHYHSPVSGTLVESKEDAGNILFGSQLMDLFLSGTPDFNVFENYKHGYFIIKTAQNGYVAVVPIGLETIGSVVFEDRVNNIHAGQEVHVAKGEKLGHFEYGGSMVMVLFEKDKVSWLTVQEGQQVAQFHTN